MKVDDRSVVNWLLSGAILLALLVYGRPLLVPLMFALLLWAVLNALVDFFRRYQMHAWLAWSAAFALIIAALYFVAVVLANEAAAVAAQAPDYAAKLQRIWVTRLPFHEMVPTFDVVTFLKDDRVARLLGQMAASIGSMFLELIVVVIYVGFLLAEQRHLPTKIARLQPNDTEARGEKVVRAIGDQIQSYLGVCTFLSAIMAIVTYALLAAMHVDFAGFWALVMFFLTYIPTVGALGVALPALMALAQFETFAPAVIILVVLSIVHFLLTNVLQTVMLGRTLNLSPFAIIISLTFWGLLWGISGLFLAVPLTGAIAIACRHVEGFGWIAELLAGPPPTAKAWHSKLRWQRR